MEFIGDQSPEGKYVIFLWGKIFKELGYNNFTEKK
jgi:hypothetical protein